MDQYQVDYFAFKKKGLISKKQAENLNKNKTLDHIKKSSTYKKVLDMFPDAELIEFKINEHKDE